MLGIEPEWLKEKRIRDTLENPLWYRKWTEKEIKQAEILFKKGKSYLEIAEMLGRTPKAIAAKAEELGYQKKLKKI